jgi:hypothetical protein
MASWSVNLESRGASTMVAAASARKKLGGQIRLALPDATRNCHGSRIFKQMSELTTRRSPLDKERSGKEWRNP